MLEISKDSTTCNQEGGRSLACVLTLLFARLVLAFRLDLDITHHAATRNKTLFSAVSTIVG